MTTDLLKWANAGYPTIKTGDEYAPARADLVSIEVHINSLEEREEIEALIAATLISEAVANECREELAHAERMGWPRES